MTKHLYNAKILQNTFKMQYRNYNENYSKTAYAGIFIAAIVALMLIVIIGINFQSAPDKVTDILEHWSLTWIKGGAIAGIVGGIVFWINHRFPGNDNLQKIIGIVTLTIVIPLMMVLLFGSATWVITTGIVLGIILGFFTNIIDDGLLNLWEMKNVTIPIIVGLGFSGSVIMACLLENWQDETISVTDHATCTKLTIERYTYHYRSSKNGGSYYSWDTHSTKHFFARGHAFPTPQEGIDYTLGYGCGRKDRTALKHYEWIGAVPYKKGHAQPFKWINLSDAKFNYPEGHTYIAEENFFGQIIQNAKPTDIDAEIAAVSPQPLPTEDDVPSGIRMVWWFIKIMCTHPDFILLRLIYLLMYVPVIILAIMVPAFRGPVIAYVVSSTIIILIILGVAAARSGEKLSSAFGGFGGGSFGGGGSNGRW